MQSEQWMHRVCANGVEYDEAPSGPVRRYMGASELHGAPRWWVFPDDESRVHAELLFQPSVEDAREVLRMPRRVYPDKPYTRDEVFKRPEPNRVADALNVAAQVVGEAMRQALKHAPPECRGCKRPVFVDEPQVHVGDRRLMHLDCYHRLEGRRPDEVDFDEWMFMRERGAKRATVEELKALLPAPVRAGDLVVWGDGSELERGVVELYGDGELVSEATGELCIRVKPRPYADGTEQRYAFIAKGLCSVVVRERDR